MILCVTDPATQRSIWMDPRRTGHDSCIVLHWLRNHPRSRRHFGWEVRWQIHIVTWYFVDSYFHIVHTNGRWIWYVHMISIEPILLRSMTLKSMHFLFCLSIDCISPSLSLFLSRSHSFVVQVVIRLWSFYVFWWVLAKVQHSLHWVFCLHHGYHWMSAAKLDRLFSVAAKYVFSSFEFLYRLFFPYFTHYYKGIISPQ